MLLAVHQLEECVLPFVVLDEEVERDLGEELFHPGELGKKLCTSLLSLMRMAIQDTPREMVMNTSTMTRNCKLNWLVVLISCCTRWTTLLVTAESMCGIRNFLAALTALNSCDRLKQLHKNSEEYGFVNVCTQAEVELYIQAGSGTELLSR